MLGKSNLTRRLGTSKKSEANRLAEPIIKHFRETILRARALKSGEPNREYLSSIQNDPDIDAVAVFSAMAEFRISALNAAFTRVLNVKAFTGEPLYKSDEAITRFAQFHGARRRLRETFLAGDISGQSDRLILDIMAKYGISLSAAHPAMAHLRTRYREIMLEVIQAEDDAVDTGNFAPVDDLAKDISRTPRQALGPKATSAEGPLSLSDLLDQYHFERKLTDNTLKKWVRAIRSLVDHCGFDDATLISRDHIISWKSSLSGKGNLQPRTISNTYLAGAKAVFGWAVDNRKLAENPVVGVIVRAPRPQLLRGKSFTMDEAYAILMATSRPKPPKLSDHMYRARRWVPWLCAYTGARVGEITQLRKIDVVKIDGHDALHITPAAGHVKNGKARHVPIHADLIERGFLKMVGNAEDGMLFCGPNASPANVSTRLSNWVREIGVSDPHVQPNHGWRHLWKSIARDAEIQPDCRDAIQGHASRTQGEQYGEWSIQALSEAMNRFPSFNFEQFER